ncbi:MAG: phosphatidate cytidylyltransferase [Rhodobacteraceae bacterium]|nr:phosphatidate cytidylyltransferase [Paracoccaceae bacterium]
MTGTGPKPGRFGDLGIRAVSGVVLGALCLFCVMIGGIPAMLLAAVLLVLLFWEYHRIITGNPRFATLPLLVLSAGGVLGIAAAGLGAAALGFVFLMIAALVAGLLSRRHFLELAGGALYIGVAIGGLLVILETETRGVDVLIWIVVIIIASDVGAYFTGRSVGGRKLCPRISPGKTCSGAIGGLACACGLSMVIAAVLGWPILVAAGAGLLVAMASQAGDLAESWLKRRAGVKDSGVLLPGHGGFLDRLDGILGGTWAFLILDALGVAAALY